jgi:hypothetical protein
MKMFRWKHIALGLLLLAALPAAVAHGEVRTIGITVAAADARGICMVSGTLPAGADAALLCALDHNEATPLYASIETGSLDVQAWVLRATGGHVLVAFRNTSRQPISLLNARIVLGLMVPVAPASFTGGYSIRELCIDRAIANRTDQGVCDLWKDAPGAVSGQ